MEDFEELWDSLSQNQKRVAEEYQYTSTQAEAARRCGLSKHTVWDWNDDWIEASHALADKRKEAIEGGLASLSTRALQLMKDALDGKSEISREQKDLIEFAIEQNVGKATQKREVEHSGGLTIDEDEIDDALSHLD